MTLVDLLAVVGNYIPIISAVISVAAVISAATPNTVDNKVLQFVVDLFNLLGFNVGNAKNGQ